MILHKKNFKTVQAKTPGTPSQFHSFPLLIPYLDYEVAVLGVGDVGGGGDAAHDLLEALLRALLWKVCGLYGCYNNFK